MAKIGGILRASFTADPVPWALWLILCRMLLEIKGLLLGFALNAPGLHLGRGSIVRGARHISLGKDIRAKSDLWLEAAVQHGDQNFEPIIRIGDGACFSDGVHISCIDRIVIKKNVLMGSHIYISDHNHGLYKGPENSLPSEPPARRKLGGGGPVLIGENVWVGDNVIIVGPVTIRDGAIIGANSVVRGNVPAYTIIAGIPARVVKRFDPVTQCWGKA